MSKQRTGFLSFFTGVAMGAVAVFLSKKENREKTKGMVDQTISQANRIKAEMEQDPEALKNKAKKKVEMVIKQIKDKILPQDKSRSETKTKSQE